MFKFRFFSLVVISMMLIVGLSAGSVFAKPNSIKVDSDGVCADADKEDNEICNINEIFVWLNINTNSPQAQAVDCADGACTLCYELIRHSDGGTECDDGLDFAGACGGRPNYLKVDLDADCLGDGGDLANDLYTLIVFNCGTGKAIGADTFSIETPC